MRNKEPQRIPQPLSFSPSRASRADPGSDAGTFSANWTPNRMPNRIVAKQERVLAGRWKQRFRVGLARLSILVVLGLVSYANAVRAQGSVPFTDRGKGAGLASILEAIVPLRSEIDDQARTARYLGTQRHGSGLVIDGNGLVLTIGYLILEANKVELLVGERAIGADVVAYDSRTGFGLVRARSPLPVRPLGIGSSKTVRERTPIMVASFGGQSGLQPALVVSRRDFAGYWEYLLEDAIFTSPPHPNFAGSALLSMDGKLLGVGYLLIGDALPGDDPVPGNMFIPIDRLKPIFGELLLEGRSGGPQRPWLGVFAQELGKNLVVTRVVEDGPAARDGVEPGDVLLGIGETPVSSLIALYRLLWSYGEPGVEIPLVLIRQGRVIQLRVTSGNRYNWFTPLKK